MFQHRHGGDGSRQLPIAEKLAAGFELRNYLFTKRLWSVLPPPRRFQWAFWNQSAELQLGTNHWH